MALLAADTPSQVGNTTAAAVPAADPQEKMICKRFVETGSLVQGVRVCKTAREWQRDRDNIRAGGPGVDSCRDRANGGQC
jgi:hypothetical protein